MLDQPLNELTATAIAAAIAQGRCAPEDVVRACLERVRAREDVVKAWAHLNPDLALARAAALAKAPARGLLHGVPVGIKDIFDTADMPTEMGSPIYRGHRPACDASAVALLRAAGAVILGKTVTAEFAGMSPGATTNPHDATRTPGGSSSGSAAAVAAGMVPLAIGTQTGGSVLRPASFCGVIGFKPSFGAINRAGIKMAAESLDTVGIYGRTIEDIERAYAALTCADAPRRGQAVTQPRIGVCRTFLWDKAQPETVAAVEGAAAMAADSGARVDEAPLGDDFATLGTDRHVINDVERARAMAWEWAQHRAAISAILAKCLERGFATSHADYVGALTRTARLRARLQDVFADCDVLLAPCVDGEAPVGLHSTGNPDFQAIWTALHVPTISLPTHRGPNGLPVGVQLVARRHDEGRLLDVARWLLARAGTAS